MDALVGNRDSEAVGLGDQRGSHPSSSASAQNGISPVSHRSSRMRAVISLGHPELEFIQFIGELQQAISQVSHVARVANALLDPAS
jgi:hypothetical protein